MKAGPAYVLGVVAASALAFGVGRSWPRAQVAATPNAAFGRGHPPAAVERPPERRAATASSVRPPERRELVTRADDDSAYLRAWRNDRVAADATRSAVIAVVERRRRERDGELRACLAGDATAGQIVRVRFDTRVRADGDVAVVGDVSDGVVLEGPPLAEDAVTCLAAVLAGSDDARAAADAAPFLSDFEGVIDYTLALAFAPSEREPP